MEIQLKYQSAGNKMRGNLINFKLYQKNFENLEPESSKTYFHQAMQISSKTLSKKLAVLIKHKHLFTSVMSYWPIHWVSAYFLLHFHKTKRSPLWVNRQAVYFILWIIYFYMFFFLESNDKLKNWVSTMELSLDFFVFIGGSWRFWWDFVGSPGYFCFNIVDQALEYKAKMKKWISLGIRCFWLLLQSIEKKDFHKYFSLGSLRLTFLLSFQHHLLQAEDLSQRFHYKLPKPNVLPLPKREKSKFEKRRQTLSLEQFFRRRRHTNSLMHLFLINILVICSRKTLTYILRIRKKWEKNHLFKCQSSGNSLVYLLNVVCRFCFIIAFSEMRFTILSLIFIFA